MGKQLPSINISQVLSDSLYLPGHLAQLSFIHYVECLAVQPLYLHSLGSIPSIQRSAEIADGDRISRKQRTNGGMSAVSGRFLFRLSRSSKLALAVSLKGGLMAMSAVLDLPIYDDELIVIPKVITMTLRYVPRVIEQRLIRTNARNIGITEALGSQIIAGDGVNQDDNALRRSKDPVSDDSRDKYDVTCKRCS